MIPTIPFLNLRQYDVTPFTGWSLSSARRSLDTHEIGQFTESARLSDHMMRDDWISGCLGQRFETITGLPFALVSAKPGDPMADRLAERAAEWWHHALPETALERLLYWDFWIGFSPASIHWDMRDQWWTPSAVEIWDPSWFYWDTTSRCFKVNSYEGTRDVRPGSGQWVVHASGGGRGGYRGWMSGAVRSLAFPWWIRLAVSRRDWPTWSETYSMPIKKLFAPTGDKGLDDPNLKQYVRDVRDMARQGTILLQKNVGGQEGHDYDLELLTDSRPAWEGFERLVASVERGISLRTLGQNLTSNVQGGSYAATKTHKQVLMWILRGSMRKVSTTARNDLLRPWVRFNAGPAYEELAPIPVWDTRTDEERKADLEAAKVFATASQGSGVSVDWAAVAHRNAIPIKAPPVAAPKS